VRLLVIPLMMAWPAAPLVELLIERREPLVSVTTLASTPRLALLMAAARVVRVSLDEPIVIVLPVPVPMVMLPLKMAVESVTSSEAAAAVDARLWMTIV